ncbi:hypothetical protein Tco_1029744 [Tanacetum coccineum]|uniref:Uncharacterized protein n=1 Tax=Tanacetum coccineum TaxID=301880 RepID=A0ABQ5G5I8_9ASTR
MGLGGMRIDPERKGVGLEVYFMADLLGGEDSRSTDALMCRCGGGVDGPWGIADLGGVYISGDARGLLSWEKTEISASWWEQSGGMAVAGRGGDLRSWRALQCQSYDMLLETSVCVRGQREARPRGLEFLIITMIHDCGIDGAVAKSEWRLSDIKGGVECSSCGARDSWKWAEYGDYAVSVGHSFYSSIQLTFWRLSAVRKYERENSACCSDSVEGKMETRTYVFVSVVSTSGLKLSA